MKSSQRTAATSLTAFMCPKCHSGNFLSLNCGHPICRRCSIGLKKCYVCQKPIFGEPLLWQQHIHAKQLVNIARNNIFKAKQCHIRRKRERQALSDDESNKNTRRTKAKTNPTVNNSVTFTDLNHSVVLPDSSRSVTISDADISEIPIILNGDMIPVEVRRSSRFSDSKQATFYYPKLKHPPSGTSGDANNSGYLNVSCSSSTIEQNINPPSSYLKRIQKTFLNKFYVELGSKNRKLIPPSTINRSTVIMERTPTIFTSKPIESGVQTPVINRLNALTDQISLDTSDCENSRENQSVLNLNVNIQEPYIQTYDIPTIVGSFNIDSDSDSNNEPCEKTTNDKDRLAIESSLKDEEKKPFTINDTETSSDEEIDFSEERPLVPFILKGRTQNETLFSPNCMRFILENNRKEQPQNDTSASEMPSKTQREIEDIHDGLLFKGNMLSTQKYDELMTENSGTMKDNPSSIIEREEKNKQMLKSSITIMVYPNPLDNILQNVSNLLNPGRFRIPCQLEKVPRVVNFVDFTDKIEQSNFDLRPTMNHDCVQHDILGPTEYKDCPVFSDDGLQPEEHVDLMQFVKQFDCEYSETVDIKTSYLVVRNQFDIESMKTFKFLMAIAHKLPIVTTDYFYNSSRYDRLLPSFEYVLKLPGPQSCTLLTRLPIFSEFVFHITDGLLSPSTEEIKELLTTCGARVVEKLEDSLNFINLHKVQIIDAFSQLDPELETIYQENSITRVDFGWIRESVFRYELIPLEQYVSYKETV